METSEQSVELPSKEQFSAMVDSTFVTQTSDGREVNFQLFKVREGASTKYQESFSLMFRTPLDVPPEQGMFELKNSAFGRISLFLVPIRQEEGHLVFEAVFNKLKVMD